MSDHDLIYSLYQIGSIQFGNFQLKSGQTSSIYVNLRKIISYPDILKTVTDLIWQKIEHKKFDLICGVPYTALPIATCISVLHHVPMILKRKEKKEYGTKQMIEGEFQANQICVLIEDVITTGSSLIETANELEHAGLIVKDMVVLIDREQQAKENLQQKYEVTTLLSLSYVLKTLYEASIVNAADKELIALQLKK